MTQKFGRNYRLTIDPKDGGEPIVITPPFTVQFSMQRNTLADLNRMDIEIYNLSEATRSRIFQDRFELGAVMLNNENVGSRHLKFEAGYSTLYELFSGDMFRANSSRNGTEIITHIEARTGKFAIAATQTFQTLQGGQTLGDVVKFLAGEFPDLSLGAVGNFDDVVHRPVVLNGNTWSLLREYSSDQVYIDNGRIYILRNEEVLDADLTVLDDSTGLLETPRRDEGFLSVTTLLEPSINMFTIVSLQSRVQKIYNGLYKVIGIIHQGMISEAVCGHARSTFQLQAPNIFRQRGKDGFIKVPAS